MAKRADEAEARLQQGIRSSELSSTGIGIALAVIGIAWLYLESGASTRYYVFRLIPASWTVLVIGLGLSGWGLFSYVQARRPRLERVSDEGVHSGRDFIPWSEVDRTYFSGSKGDGWDVRTLKVVAKGGRQIELRYSFSGNMSEADEKAFADLRATVLAHLGKRLWGELAELLSSGGKYEFIPGVFVAGEGFVEADGRLTLPWSRLDGYEVQKGMVDLKYRDNDGSARAWQIGSLSEVANFEIFAGLLDQMIARHGAPAGADRPRG